MIIIQTFGAKWNNKGVKNGMGIYKEGMEWTISSVKIAVKVVWG